MQQNLTSELNHTVHAHHETPGKAFRLVGILAGTAVIVAPMLVMFASL